MVKIGDEMILLPIGWILSYIMGFVERILRLFLELHAFELRERGSSSGAVVDRTSHTQTSWQLLQDYGYTKHISTLDD